MVEGPVKIIMAIKEPISKDILWMRPYLDREGYELLYYGSRGWTRWIPCCHKKHPCHHSDDKPLEEIPPAIDGDMDCEFDETMPPPREDRPCGC